MVFQGFNKILMQNPLLILYLTMHILADFHFQPQQLADQKQTSFIHVLQHLLWVAGCYLVLNLLSFRLFVSLLLIIGSHLFIDTLKYWWTRRNKMSHNQALFLFLLDQFLHFGMILAIYHWGPHVSLNFNNQTLILMLFTLLITKPVNVLFKLAFGRFQSSDINQEETVKGAGAMVGNLERLTMGLLMLLGQFASIGLVFTAKSIARYNKISESPSFAEYYLIGSLYSIIAVLVLYGLLFY